MSQLESILSDASASIADVITMNRYLGLLSKKWIEYIWGQAQNFANDYERERRFQSFVEIVKSDFIVLLRKAAFPDPFKVSDLSPWPIIRFHNLKISQITAEGSRGSRSFAMPELVPNDEFRESKYKLLSYATAVVLAALPLSSVNASDNTFIKIDVHFRTTPLMHALENRYTFNKDIIQVLCLRGGFSSEEWTTGKVLRAFCMLESDWAALLLHFFRDDIIYYINQPLEYRNSGSCTPLHYCCQSHDLSGLFQQVQLLISLGANPTIVDSHGRLPRDSINSRMKRGINDDDEYNILGSVRHPLSN